MMDGVITRYGDSETITVHDYLGTGQDPSLIWYHKVNLSQADSGKRK